MHIFIKNIKKIVALSLSLCLAICLLTGCNAGNTGKSVLSSSNAPDDNYRNYYEIFVYSFYDSNGDGIGDIEGVRQKLSYIKDMGFNGIWLTPIMPSDSYHKYDVKDYKDIDPEFGTLDDMQNLLKDAHKKGIRIIIDFVMNHTSSENDWFIEATDYLKGLDENDSRSFEEMADECQYVGYYHFSKEKKSEYYHEVTGTKYYYEGYFSYNMPDLNLDNELVRKEFEDIASFWVNDMGVDGFRMDAVPHYSEDEDIAYNTEIMSWLYNYCKNINPDFYMVSEAWVGEATTAKYYQSKTDSMFNFNAAGAEGHIIATARGTGNASAFVNTMKYYETLFGDVYSDYIDAVFITNHDQARVANALMSDEAALKYAGGLLMSMNGSTFVYYGEEIGMSSKGTKDENKRLPMRWSETDSTGMTSGPEDADPDIEQKFEPVDKQTSDQNSILNYYKKALSIRNSYPEIARGTISIVDELTDGKLATIFKTYNNSSIAIVYNNSASESREIDVTDTPIEDLSIVGYLTVDGSTITVENGVLTLPARSIVYLK